jgi:hypothetical protein
MYSAPPRTSSPSRAPTIARRGYEVEGFKEVHVGEDIDHTIDLTEGN